MPEYQLKFTEEQDEFDESRQETMNELNEFISAMNDRPLAIVTLDQKQSILWDQEGEIDYQDEYGSQIIAQMDGDNTIETLVIRNIDGLPVALAALNDNSPGWQGIGIDKRLRFEIATMLQNDETEFS